jgi:soluble lytic murein transglycosylase-like protein
VQRIFTRQAILRLVRVSATAWMVTAALGLAAASRPQSGTDDARLPGTAYPEAVRLAEAGRAAEALAVLERSAGATGETPVDALALEADTLAAVGRYRESAARWDEVGRREPALAARARRKAAEAAIAGGDALGAVERLGSPARSGPARGNHDLLIETAAAFRTGGDPARAAALAGAVATIERRGPLADAARLEQAAAQEAAGEPIGAIATLREVERNFRSAPAFIRAWQEERRLAGTLTRDPAPFTEGEYQAMADRLSGAARFAEALEVLRTWARTYSSSPNLDRIDADIVENLYRMRANDEARTRAAAFVARHPTSAELARVRLIEFRLDVREGRTADVKAHGMALWRGGAGRPSTQTRRNAASLLAAYLVSVGEEKAGLAVYRDLFAATRGRSAQIDVLWRAGVAAYRAGEYDRAAANLRAALNRRPGASTADLVAYWLAVTDLRLGRREAAVNGLSALASESPYGYYGLRAAARLEGLGVTPPAPAPVEFPTLTLQSATRSRPEFREATVLARAGLDADAAEAARALARATRGDAAAAILAVRASDRAGQYRPGLGLLAGSLGRFVDNPGTGAPDDFLMLAYPKAFWPQVQPVATAQQVDPRLMLAIMRRESRFDPGARSAAGAMGLFQIMTYTAEALAPEAGIEEPDEDRLVHPPTNATLAATLVKKLLGLFDGRPVPVMAAFNAGEERVGTWWTAARDTADDLFVDTMPYSETRAYVREVWVNYEMYKKLYP